MRIAEDYDLNTETQAINHLQILEALRVRLL
jgi:hypothetical protein